MSAPKRPPHDGLLLGDEMKRYEDATCASMADLSRTCVVRLDGHCFHTYTRGFRRPYDVRIHEAMVLTATDLLERFGATTVRGRACPHGAPTA
eukprot:scaffold27643_cov129-Isochrysis_galbana.AAC.2